MTEKLFIFEALELRNQYDKEEKMYESILRKKDLFGDNDEAEHVDEIKEQHLEEELKNLKILRIKLNQAIQLANLSHKFTFEGNEITLSEALEMRKSMIEEINNISGEVHNSAFKKIIHKEGRDIVKNPKKKFSEMLSLFRTSLHKVRQLGQEIHKVNHTIKVNFRFEN